MSVCVCVTQVWLVKEIIDLNGTNMVNKYISLIVMKATPLQYWTKFQALLAQIKKKKKSSTNDFSVNDI